MLKREKDRWILFVFFFEKDEAIDFSSSCRRAHNLLFVMRIDEVGTVLNSIV